MTYSYHYTAIKQPDDKPLISGYLDLSEPLAYDDKTDLKKRVAAQFGIDPMMLKLTIQLMKMGDHETV
jgi:hypothetical protein